jgi:hypothetical protein
MSEARRTQRHRVLKAGSIRFGEATISCILRNMSSAGVALDVGSPVGIPEQFTLFIEAENKLYSCFVIWRKERRLGVAFVH